MKHDNIPLNLQTITVALKSSNQPLTDMLLQNY